tara:strand:+ start:148 stop:1392 length:1245 start_codon:yes stop_codon:yes gene_type:complete
MLTALTGALAAPARTQGQQQQQLSASSHECDSTVSYLFLTPSLDLPLSAVWREYFDGCPKGSYTVHVHAQSLASQSGSDLRTDLPEALVLDQPVTGEMRFSYRMQEAMNLLYRNASMSTAANGCTPMWAQMLSDSCAPVTTCTAAHARLAELRGKSQFEGYSIHQTKPKNQPLGWKPTGHERDSGYKWWFQSQWSTLWMPHAQLILKHELENRPSWEAVTNWPVDSHYTINLLYSLDAEFSAEFGTTAVAWQLPTRGLTADQAREELMGHPLEFDCSSTEIDGKVKLFSTPSAPDASASDEEPKAAASIKTSFDWKSVLSQKRHGGAAVSLIAGSSAKMDPNQKMVSAADVRPGDDVRTMLAQAVACGRLFARKFGSNCAPLLREHLHTQSDALVPAEVHLYQGMKCNQAKMAP